MHIVTIRTQIFPGHPANGVHVSASLCQHNSASEARLPVAESWTWTCINTYINCWTALENKKDFTFTEECKRPFPCQVVGPLTFIWKYKDFAVIKILYCNTGISGVSTGSKQEATTVTAHLFSNIWWRFKQDTTNSHYPFRWLRQELLDTLSNVVALVSTTTINLNRSMQLLVVKINLVFVIWPSNLISKIMPTIA